MIQIYYYNYNSSILRLTKLFNLSYTGSDGTTRDESNSQKVLAGYESGNTNARYELGNTNQGSSYFITPEGQKITLSWVADENGFIPKGDHLPTPPPIPAEIAAVLPTLPKLVDQYQPAYPKPAYP